MMNADYETLATRAHRNEVRNEHSGKSRTGGLESGGRGWGGKELEQSLRWTLDSCAPRGQLEDTGEAQGSGKRGRQGAE